MSFHLLPNGLEEAQFKRVSEGWLFTTASPWIFASRRTYLVSDAQKPALAERVRRGRYLRLAVILLLMVLMTVGIIVTPAVLMLVKTFSLTGAIVFASFVVLTVAAITVCDYLNIRSFIGDLPRSSRKIGHADMMQSQTQAMSAPAIAIFASLFVVATAGKTYEALTSASGNWMAAVAAACFAPFALAFLSMLVVKLRNRHAS
jgi:cytochrome c oxidase subunit IV